jgi:putative hydrolase of the HAD superfamily
MDVDAVLFDLDDTLHDDTATFRRAALDTARAFALTHPVGAEALAGAYISQADQFWKTLSNDRIGVSMGTVRSEMWRSALLDVGIDDPALAAECADAYNRSRRVHLRVWPGVPRMLERLRAAGLKLGMITNGFAETHREKIALLELEAPFDAILIADEVGMVKPDPRIFEHACELLGVTPARSVMVGDRYDRDVRGARDAGLRTVWLNVRREQLPDGAPAPDVTIFDIGELEAALAR